MCQVARTVRQASELTRGSLSTASPHSAPRLPLGTYVTKDTVADLRAGGLYGADWSKDIVFTARFSPDGTFLSTQQPGYPDQGPVRGRYTAHGDQLSSPSTRRRTCCPRRSDGTTTTAN